jgi:hypothetical protein
MNEFFLISITILTALIHGNDKAPALLYGLVCHIVYFVDMFAQSPAVSLVFAGICDAVVVLLLVCLSGCLRSRITFFIIPLSFVSAAIQAWGWMLVMAERSSDYWLHHSLSVAYMCVILALFAFAAGGYGNIRWDNRLLNRDVYHTKNMAMVSK